MNYDIVSTQGDDLRIQKTDVPRAANVLRVQLGALEYAPAFGIDLSFFLESEFAIQDASFKAYLVRRLLEHKINVVNVQEVVGDLYKDMIFGIDDNKAGSGTELIG